MPALPQVVNQQTISYQNIRVGDGNPNTIGQYGEPGWIYQDWTGGELYVCTAAGTSSWTATSGGSPVAPVSLGNVTGATSISRAAGERFNATATGNVTLTLTGGSDYDELNLWLIASGADRTLDLNAVLQKPSDSAISFPVTITSGKGCRVKFEKHGSTWMLVSLVKSYTL